MHQRLMLQIITLCSFSGAVENIPTILLLLSEILHRRTSIRLSTSQGTTGPLLAGNTYVYVWSEKV